MREAITDLAVGAGARAREKRALIFRDRFHLSPDTRILDMGSETGANIAAILGPTQVRPENVYIADIDSEAVKRGHERFGFTPVEIPESGGLPYPDHFFDIVFCSSVIEHVTVPKDHVWDTTSGKQFFEQAWLRQQAFAKELRRLGKSYFVQTPSKFFPVESHTWLPFLGYLPRRFLIPTLKVTNRYWVKSTSPDWNLLTTDQMRSLFPEAEIVHERFMGFVKSIMAIRVSRD